MLINALDKVSLYQLDLNIDKYNDADEVRGVVLIIENIEGSLEFIRIK